MVGGEQGRQPTPAARVPELEGPTAQLVELIRPAHAAMRRATAALFATDSLGTDRIGAVYEALSTLHRQVEDHAAVLLASGVRLAGAELPAVIAAAHINAEAERMGHLAREVAEIARTRRSWASIPAPLLGVLG